MHANISPLLVQQADVVTVYQTHPHVDARVQARAAAQLVGRTVRREIAPVIAMEKPPLAINILRQGTDDQPMRGLLSFAAEQAARPGVLSVSVVEGYPYADVRDLMTKIRQFITGWNDRSQPFHLDQDRRRHPHQS